MKIPGKCTGPKFLTKSLAKWRRQQLGGYDLVRRTDGHGEGLIWSRCFGIREAKNGTETDELLHTRTDVHQRIYGKMLRIIQTLEDGSVPAKEAKNWRIEGQKKRVTGKEYQRLLNKFEMESFMAQRSMWNLCVRNREL